MSLQNSPTEVFSNFRLKYNECNCCLITIGINTVAVIKNSQQSFNMFDAHSSDLLGMPHSFGKCTLLTIEGIEIFLFANFLLTNRGCSFGIKGVFVRDNELDLQNVHESPKIEHLPFSDRKK